MLSISESEVDLYKENGFVVSNDYLSDELIVKITVSYDEFIKTNPNLSLEEMASPHLYGGVGMKHKLNEDLCKKFLEIGKSSEIVSQVKKI